MNTKATSRPSTPHIAPAIGIQRQSRFTESQSRPGSTGKAAGPSSSCSSTWPLLSVVVTIDRQPSKGAMSRRQKCGDAVADLSQVELCMLARERQVAPPIGDEHRQPTGNPNRMSACQEEEDQRLRVLVTSAAASGFRTGCAAAGFSSAGHRLHPLPRDADAAVSGPAPSKNVGA